MAARPFSVSYLQDEAATDIKAIMNSKLCAYLVVTSLLDILYNNIALLQSIGNEQIYRVPINSLGWSAASVKTQKFTNLLKNIGSE